MMFFLSMANGISASTACDSTMESRSLMPIFSSATWATVLSFSGGRPICWANPTCACCSARFTSSTVATASSWTLPSPSFF